MQRHCSIRAGKVARTAPRTLSTRKHKLIAVHSSSEHFLSRPAWLARLCGSTRAPRNRHAVRSQLVCRAALPPSEEAPEGVMLPVIESAEALQAEMECECCWMSWWACGAGLLSWGLLAMCAVCCASLVW